MKIVVSAEDLVKRCLWDSYVYYVVGSEKEAEKIFLQGGDFEISERDALVIGLLKVIETDNLIHKFNMYLTDFLTNKSISSGKDLIIRKKTVEMGIEKFNDKFPPYWNPQHSWKQGLDNLNLYLQELKSNLEELEIQKITDQFGTHEYIISNSIKKLLKFNYQ